MRGLIVRMVREFAPDGAAPDGIVHVRVFPSGELELAHALGVPALVLAEVAATEERRRSRSGSQLLTVRQMALMGWRVCDPSLWEEAEA